MRSNGALPREDVRTAAASEEAARLGALAHYRILHTPEEPEYDEAAALAADLCDAPAAVVSLLSADELWFKARFGLTTTTTPREHAFCTHAMSAPLEPLVVEDATADPRFRDNPFVTGPQHIRAYLGAPLKAAGDHFLGTLAVLDTRPRRWTPAQVRRITTLGSLVEAHLELRLALSR